MSRPAAFAFILLSLVFQILSLIFGKFGALALREFTPRAILANPWYLASLACLGLQAVCWPMALRRYPLFWAYLFMSGLFVAIPPVSYFIFKEGVGAANIAGSALIMAGIAVMLSGGREAGGERG